MRIKTNHFNVGHHQEVTLVCAAKEEAFFSKVAQSLTEHYAVKTGLFLYDRDRLDAAEKHILAGSYYVLFMLTPGVTEDSVKNPNHRFRQVFGYVNKVNPYSVSLVAVDGCQVDYSLEFPPDMSSFNWLHRKSFTMTGASAASIARQFYQEFRLSFSRREKTCLEKLARDGCDEWASLFSSQKRTSTVLLLASIFFALTLYAIDQKLVTNSFLSLGLAFLMILFCGVMMIAFAVLVAKAIFLRDQLYDVSTVFADFRRITVKRLTILLGICLCVLGMPAIDSLSRLTTTLPMHLLILIPMVGISLILRIKLSLQRKAALRSSCYVEFCEKKRRIHRVCTGLCIALPLLMVAAELFSA